jgi:probable F420-dependent oxidoreductase
VEIGLFSINQGVCSYPEGLARVAALAEELGYDSLWAGEHMVVPSPRVPPSPMEPTDRMLDPIPALTYAAAHTSRVLLGTGILLIPQRHPVALAKELASLDVLSNGRVLMGVGVGYLEPEMRALGVPMEDRAARTVEYLEAMHALWTMEAPSYHGRYVDFEGVDAHPRPVQADGIPIVMGGHTPPAYRRAVAFSHGWYGFGLDPEHAAESIAGLKRAADEVERKAGLPELEISVTPRGLKDGWLEQFGEIGVDRVVLIQPPKLDASQLEDWMQKHSPANAA